jgi:hypothetical protein
VAAVPADEALGELGLDRAVQRIGVAAVERGGGRGRSRIAAPTQEEAEVQPPIISTMTAGSTSATRAEPALSSERFCPRSPARL